MQIVSVEVRYSAQSYPIYDLEPPFVAHNGPICIERLKRSVDVHRRQSGCLAYLYLSHWQLKRVSRPQPRGLAACYELTKHMRHASLRVPLPHIEYPLSKNRRVDQALLPYRLADDRPIRREAQERSLGKPSPGRVSHSFNR